MEIENDPYERAKQAAAAKHMTTHDPTNPTWRHRRVGDRVESKTFPADSIPEGWYETVAEIPKEPEPVEPPKRKPGRPKGSANKVTTDDDS